MRVHMAVVCASLVFPVTSSLAASLQLSPVSVEVRAPGAATTIKLRNEGASPINAQLRVFRWVQENGIERLEPTNDVVASPPIANLGPNTEYTIRIVRVTKRPASRGETYRLLVDELPSAQVRQNRAVTLVMRYSIPVFFYPIDVAGASLTWSVEQNGGQVYVLATNGGDRHVRLSAMNLRASNGTTVDFGKGLTGYVLGRSTMRWAAPVNVRRWSADTSVVIAAQSDYGPINSDAQIQKTR